MNDHDRQKHKIQFTDSQIALAVRLKHAGLAWQPGVGQYAYDLDGVIGPGSPFQTGVYFFLDFPCFVDYFGSVERLSESMVWLPTWEQARDIAKQLAIDNDRVEQACFESIGQVAELDSIYRLILTELDPND